MGFRIRLLAACGLFSSWMILLLTGLVLAGWSHLVLLGALLVFPWRQAAHPGRNHAEEPRVGR
ncbi:MAG TPA: hypothetical protein VGG06_28045 [Thermoanaerobaculia bacterium]|jgi:hypothetical protein